MSPDLPSQLLPKLVDEYDEKHPSSLLPRIRLHDLRHDTFALAIADASSGENKAVNRLLSASVVSKPARAKWKASGETSAD